MRAVARKLSASLRDAHTAVRWDELAAKPDSLDLLWRRAKRVGPQVLRVLRRLLEGEPETAFMLDPRLNRRRRARRRRRRNAGALRENERPLLRGVLH